LFSIFARRYEVENKFGVLLFPKVFLETKGSPNRGGVVRFGDRGSFTMLKSRASFSES